MKYTISTSSYRSWNILKEDGYEYYVTARKGDKGFLNFRCSCEYFTYTGKVCKHINMVKEHLASGKREFIK